MDNYLNIQFEILKENKGLESKSQVLSFENALSNIAQANDVQSIKKLLFYLDDNSCFDEVMFSIIHTIEHLYKSNELIGIGLIIEEIDKLNINQKDWTIVLFKRILNGESTRNTLKTLYQNITNIKSLTILLNEIKAQNSNAFENKVNEILLN